MKTKQHRGAINNNAVSLRLLSRCCRSLAISAVAILLVTYYYSDVDAFSFPFILQGHHHPSWISPPCRSNTHTYSTKLCHSPLIFTTSAKNIYFLNSNSNNNNILHHRRRISQNTLYLWKDIFPDTKEEVQTVANDVDETKKKLHNSSDGSNSTILSLTNTAVKYFSKLMVPIVTVVNNNWTDIAVTFLTESFVNSTQTKTMEGAGTATKAELEPQVNLFSFISSINIPPIPFLSSTTVSEGETSSSSVAKPYQKYMVKSDDLSAETFGPLLPLAERVDEWTGGWGLFYADLSPETTTTPLGVTFLLTNLAYALAGFLLTIKGEIVLGTMTECAGAVSFWYHYSQLKYSGQEKNVQVRLALLTDYIFAGSALITGGLYALMLGPFSLPLNGLLSAIAAVLCLALSWKWEFGLPYIVWHSLWHILSALTGYLIGQAYIDNNDAAVALVTTIIVTMLR